MRHNPRRLKMETRGVSLAFGSHGLKAITAGRIKARQIEAARKAIVHHAKRGGKLWIRIFPDKPYTAKPAEVGMGKGKGDIQGYEFIVWPGRILFEIDGMEDGVAREALRRAGAKLSLKTRLVTRS